MKKGLLAIVFASGMIAACQKTDIFSEARIPLEFKGEMVKQTKASGNPSATNDELMQNLHAQDFRVWAYKNWDDPITTENEINQEYDGIANLLISYNSTTTKWDTGLDYYWPGLNKSLKFYAVSSSNWTKPGNTGADNAEAITITHESNSTSLGTMKIDNFLVTSKADNDLMIADACIQQQKGSTSTTPEGVVTENSVTQTFRHALTKVRFSFITTNSTIPVFVQDITTTALYNKGNLTVDFKDALTSSDWDTSTANSKVTFKDNYDKDIDFAGKSVTEVWENGKEEKTSVSALTDKTGITLNSDGYTNLDTWLMIPQELKDQTVTITYILKDRQFSRTFSLAATDLTSWEPNQFVNYKVTIAPNLIEFEATVEGWTEKEVTVNDSATDSAS